MKQIIIIFIAFILCKTIIAAETYFDLSEKEIEIKTDFRGKEIIIFGTFEEGEDIIILIQGPKKDTKIMKKERILGFWFNTKKVIYQNLPSLFFISSSAPIKNILKSDMIIKEKLYFDELLVNNIIQKDFIEKKNLENWNANLIKIKKNNQLFKEHIFETIENKLFQTRIFFPTNSIPGQYNVSIYQIKDFAIINKKNKTINIKKSGIGEKVFEFANKQPAAYGLFSIIFAVLSGLIAATLFRRL